MKCYLPLEIFHLEQKTLESNNLNDNRDKRISLRFFSKHLGFFVTRANFSWMLNKENKCKEKGLKSLLGPKHIWYLKAQVAKAITLILFETEKYKSLSSLH